MGVTATIDAAADTTRRHSASASTFRLAVALIAFGLLALLAVLPVTHRWDEAATRWLQRAAPLPDVPASILVLLGNAEVVIPAVALVAVLSFRAGRPGAAGTAWLAVALTVGSVLAVAFKHIIVHPGPTAPFQRMVFAVGLQASTPYSFPSGHTVRTTILAVTALRRVPWRAGVLVLAMMAALVYLGDHWLSEVLGGLCLGWALLEAQAVVRKSRCRSCRRG